MEENKLESHRVPDKSGSAKLNQFLLGQAATHSIKVVVFFVGRIVFSKFVGLTGLDLPGQILVLSKDSIQ